MSRADDTATRETFRPHAAEAFAAPNGPEAAAARALAEAVESGDAARVSTLLASGAFADARLRGGETPLMRAASRGYADVVRVLLDAGADASARRADGFTPLILAAFFGHEEAVRLLLERGADASARTALGTTAERWAASRGFESVTALLRSTTHRPAHAVSEAARAKTPGDPLEEVGIFSRKGARETSEATRDKAAGRPKIDEGAAVKSDEGSTVKTLEVSRVASSSGTSARDSVRKGEGRGVIGGVLFRDDASVPAHPSESAFSFGRFARSWHASVGTALLLAAFGVGAYALLRGGSRESFKPAQPPQRPVAQQPTPAQTVPAQQPSPTPLTPEMQTIAPAPDVGYPVYDTGSQPYYVPPASSVPPPQDVPRDLTVVSESGAPTPDDSARRKPKPEPTQTPRQSDDPKPEGGRRDDSDRTPRDTDARPAPTARPTPQPSAPSERRKVIQWPPQ